MAGDHLGQAGAQAFHGAAIGGGEGLLGGRLGQVAQQPVLGEEPVPAGGPGVDLPESAQVAVMVPAEPVTGRAAVEGGQVISERFPGAFAVITVCQCLQQQQPPGHCEYPWGRHIAGPGQHGQAVGLGLEQARDRVGESLADHARAVRVGDQLGVGDGPAGQPPDRADTVGPPEGAQLAAQDAVAGFCCAQCFPSPARPGSVRQVPP
jgi:hypothetical protein